MSEPLQIVQVYGSKVWTERDSNNGDMRVMVQSEAPGAKAFAYCTFHYVYPWTDNARTQAEAERSARRLRGEDADRIATLERERNEAQADAAAVRELMNVYNLGGWTDAVAPMKRALAAEAQLAERTREFDARSREQYDRLLREEARAESAEQQVEKMREALRDRCIKIPRPMATCDCCGMVWGPTELERHQVGCLAALAQQEGVE